LGKEILKVRGTAVKLGEKENLSNHRGGVGQGGNQIVSETHVKTNRKRAAAGEEIQREGQTDLELIARRRKILRKKKELFVDQKTFLR